MPRAYFSWFYFPTFPFPIASRKPALPLFQLPVWSGVWAAWTRGMCGGWRYCEAIGFFGMVDELRFLHVPTIQKHSRVLDPGFFWRIPLRSQHPKPVRKAFGAVPASAFAHMNKGWAPRIPLFMFDLQNWLVVWNIFSICCIGNIWESYSHLTNIFQRGRYTTNRIMLVTFPFFLF